MKYQVKGMLFGVEDPETHALHGVIRRSGLVDQCGHFCFVDISVEGKTVTADGAEDRIFPFHTIYLDHLPKGGWPALGWCVDQNTYAFLVDGEICEVLNGYTFSKIEESLWKPTWKEKTKDSAQDPRGEAQSNSPVHKENGGGP